MKKQAFITLLLIILVSCAPTNILPSTEGAMTPTAEFVPWMATKSIQLAKCELLDKSAVVSTEALLPSKVVSGPAEIIPNPYIVIFDLSISLGIDTPVAGGLIIPSGESAKIPQELTLVSDKTRWIPNGTVITYADDDLMWKHIRCWTAAKSP